VIRKALVELDGKPFRFFEKQRDKWALYPTIDCLAPSSTSGTGRDRYASLLIQIDELNT